MLLFTDGFDAYGATADLTKKYIQNVGAGVTWSATGGRFGGPCLQLGGGSSYVLTAPLKTTVSGISVHAFWWKCPTPPTTGGTFMAMTEGTLSTAWPNRIGVNSGSGTINVIASYSANGQVNQNGNVNVCDGNWHWIEVRFDVHTSGNTPHVWVCIDGALDFVVGGQINNPVDIFDRLLVGWWLTTAGVTASIDDLLVWDDQVGLQTGELVAANYPIGPKRCETMWPSGAGSNTNWSPLSGANYTNVDENPTNWDTDYVQASSSGLRDSYAFPGTVGGINPLVAVVNVVAKNADAGSINIQGLTYSGGSYGLGDSKPAGSNYATQQFPIFRDPNTGAAWTKAGVNAAQFGVGVV